MLFCNGRRERPRSRIAFTLIELLVVIAIIAILAAILFPVFAQARAKARQANCISNLKQQALAVQMYTTDYDGAFPYWNWWYQADVGDCGSRGNPQLDAGCGRFDSLWFNALYPYTKNAGIFDDIASRTHIRPSDNNGNNEYIWGWTRNSNVVAAGLLPAVANQPMAYGISESLHFGELFSWPGNGPTTDAQLERPAQVMVIADSASTTTGTPYGGNDQWGDQAQPDPTNPNDPRHHCIVRRVAYSEPPWLGLWPEGRDPCNAANPAWDGESRHSAGSVIGYADGHAKFLRNSKVTIDLFWGTHSN